MPLSAGGWEEETDMSSESWGGGRGTWACFAQGGGWSSLSLAWRRCCWANTRAANTPCSPALSWGSLVLIHLPLSASGDDLTSQLALGKEDICGGRAGDPACWWLGWGFGSGENWAGTLTRNLGGALREDRIGNSRALNF